MATHSRAFKFSLLKIFFFPFVKTNTCCQLYRSGKVVTIYETLNKFQYFTSSNLNELMFFFHKLKSQTLVQFKYNLTDHSLRVSRETLILTAAAHTNIKFTKFFGNTLWIHFISGAYDKEKVYRPIVMLTRGTNKFVAQGSICS